ncbi:MAG: DNA-3-methyladenine glycosylase 2 family protein [Deltaproteobacteria bacterium]|nr:DNA-3-methyladenine glycosylase 2 family protein [Deltaproteobacteria bacterium]
MRPDPEACWRAFTSRDRRFDGRFFAAVRTTGIYCRPGCPARLPARQNVTFYSTAAAAESAGFRPCRRCRPDSAPGSPAWLGAPALVGRALRLIEAGSLGAGGEGESRGVEVLAERLGITGRRLRQLFEEHVGASPLKVAHTHRSHLARRLLEQTSLPLEQVALAAGYSGVRRMHAALSATFRCAPRELRCSRKQAAASGLRLWLPARLPFDPGPTLAFLALRALPGVEFASADTYRRTYALDGAAGVLEARLLPTGVELTLSSASPRALVPVAARIQRVFDLDADVQAIAAHLRRDPWLRALVPRAGVRIPGAWDPFELVVRALLGQQVTVTAARTLASRLVERCGEELPPGLASEGLRRVFPTPQRLAIADLGELGITRARAQAIRAVASAVASGKMDLAALHSLDKTVAMLKDLPGVGEWTAQYVSLRALGEPDAFPAGDLGLRRALSRDGLMPVEREVQKRSERWRPWRAYAAIALWSGSSSVSR